MKLLWFNKKITIPQCYYEEFNERKIQNLIRSVLSDLTPSLSDVIKDLLLMLEPCPSHKNRHILKVNKIN